MRQAWFLALLRRAVGGVVLAGGLGLACSGLGCHPYYYYCPPDPCAPAYPAASSVRTGPVCEVPTQVVEGGTTLAEGSSRSTTVTGGATAAPRVIVSEPANPIESRLSWRRSDPDGSLATTSVQGTIDDAKVNR
jgi:hypothetical protein